MFNIFNIKLLYIHLSVIKTVIATTFWPALCINHSN
jgi:hypothetical protein